MMDRDVGFASIGILIGFSLTVLLVENVGIIPIYDDMKELCEAEIPRNKECVMTFVEGQ